MVDVEQGVDIEKLAADALELHACAFEETNFADGTAEAHEVPNPGDYSYRGGSKSEKHMNDPTAIAMLREASAENSRWLQQPSHICISVRGIYVCECVSEHLFCFQRLVQEVLNPQPRTE